MCIEIFGYGSPGAKLYAVELGIALQLTNILRDLGPDARRGRLYLPLDELDRFGAREEDLLAGRRTPEVMALLAWQADRAERFYQSAARLLDPRDRRSLVAAEVMRRIYRRILEKIVASSFDVFERRIGLSRPRRAGIALATWLGSRTMTGPADVIVVGAGVAGLAAATRLAEAGARVLVLEASKIPGGRARSWTDPATGATVDNGQHLLMGCYAETLALLERIGSRGS